MYIAESTTIAQPVISLQYQYFLEDKFITDTVHIAVTEAQPRLAGDSTGLENFVTPRFNSLKAQISRTKCLWDQKICICCRPVLCRKLTLYPLDSNIIYRHLPTIYH